MGKNSIVSVNANNENKINDHYYLFSSPLLVDTRTIIKSDPSLAFKKTWSASANFSHYNLLKQSNFSFLASYQEAKNTFLASQNISEDLSMITYFQTPLTKKDITLSASTGFFVSPINNKINFSTNATYNRYFNSLNDKPIKIVRSSIYNFNLELKSAFDFFFNYKSSIGFTYIKNKQENANAFFNRTINARLEAIFKFSKKTYFTIENNLLLSKGSTIKENQIFIDFSFYHITKNIEYFILAKNLLDKGTYTQVYTTEFSTSIFSTNLFDRYIVFGLNYAF